MSKISSLIVGFFICFLFFPYILLSLQLPQLAWPSGQEFFWALKNSITQASISAFFTLFVAIFFSFGFCTLSNMLSKKKFSQRAISLLEILIILPTFLPALFMILLAMAVINPFPAGFVGVILIHTLLNAGLATILVTQIIFRKLVPLLELAAVEGSTRWQFLKASFGGIRKELASIYIFLFVLCFANFSVPFAVGSGNSTTLEILIYEKIRISGNWGQALSLALIQLLILAGFSFFNPQFRPQLSLKSQNIKILPLKISAIFLLIFAGSPVLIFLFKSLTAWENVFAIPGLWQAAQETVTMSLLFSLSAGFLILIFLIMSAYLDSKSFMHRLLLSIVSPSTALVGFSLLFFISDREPWISLKWIVGFAYLVFTTLYRWGWRQSLADLDRQVAVAESLGASDSMIFTKIKLPQLIQGACRIAGIASLWAMGDFALGKIILAEDITLSLLIQTLMQSYRTEAALALMSLLMLMGIFSYLIFLGVGYVGRRWSEQEI